MRRLGAIALAAALAALAAYARDARGVTAASVSAAAAKNPASASDGAVVYLANCSSCHQPDGTGVAGAFPPLAGNAVVAGDPAAVIAIVKNGLDGRIVVNGRAYDGVMPPWKGLIADEQIAEVVSYIRGSWKSHAPGVSISDVRSVK